MKSVKKSKKNSTRRSLPKNHRILVVEDESIIALDLQHILQSSGFEVCQVVSSGEESILAANQIRPDIVLMDVKLKGDMSGIDAAKEIHRSLDIPVIYLTAFGDESTLRNALAHRDFVYIRKPFEEREIERAVKKSLQRSASDEPKTLGH